MAETKNKFKTAVDAGNIIYTASRQYTYGNFTGLVYIDLDPITGSGAYIIGEGLNGGYTVEEWPTGWSNFWRKRLPNLKATILSPSSNQTFTQGETIPWHAYYESTLLGEFFYAWHENIDIKTDPLPGDLIIGNNILRSGYGTNASVEVVIKSRAKLGKNHDQYDDIIIDKANKYGIPPGILKAIIHKETQNNPFSPYSSRYEPKRDFQNFSGYDADVIPSIPRRNIDNSPFSYYKLSGINTRGQSIAMGTRVNSLPRNYKTTLKNTRNGGWQLREIIITDRPEENGPPNGILTVDELYANDHDIDGGITKQGWPVFREYWVGSKSYHYTGNFTPQFLISSSYGLGHVMYLEATEALDPQGNKVMQDVYNTYSPHAIVDNPNLGIELAASILFQKFKNSGGQLVPNDDCAGWRDAVYGYNPDLAYRDDVCGIYTSNYSQIITY